MAILLTGTTIGGHSAIHAGNLATHGIVTTSNIGSYALTSIPATISPTNIYVGNAIYFGGGNNYLNWTSSRIYTNVGFESAGTIYASGGNSSNWNTAYSWGNHASAGYLTSVPNHSAALLTSGTLPQARLPEFLEEKYIYTSNDSNGVFMPMVKGGLLASASTTVTGAIKVTLPSYKSSMMFTIYVDIYEYTTGETVTLRVSGYAYSDAGATWHNCSVVNIADNTDRDYVVRFYSDTTNNKQYFTIGETNSTWSYPQVNLRDFWGGYNTSESEALGAWNVEFVSSFSGTLRHTFSGNFAASDWDSIRDKPSTFAPSAHTHSAADITSGSLSGDRLDWNSNDGFDGTYSIVWRATNDLYTASWLQVRGSDDTLLTRNIRTGTNNTITLGPNSTWSKELIIGSDANNSSSSAASIGVTNGNLHLDAAVGSFGTYLNYYDGTAGVAFGNGASNIVAWMGPDGDLWKGASDNTGQKYWHAGDFANNSSNWNTAYEWGNHASAGYLTSLPSHNHDDRYYTESESDARYHRKDGPVILTSRGADSAGSAAYAASIPVLADMLNNTALELHSGNDEPVTIYFKSTVNAPSDFAYISFDPDYNNSGENAALVLGVENDGAGSSDYIRLQGRVSTVVDYISSEASVIQDWVYQGTQVAYLDISGNLQVDGTITASNGNSTQWNTAYGWGNHASAGYITSLSGYATTSYVDTAVSNLVDSAPGTLDTLNELAAALGDDPNFATTVTNSIAGKLPLTGGTLSGDLRFNQGAGYGRVAYVDNYHGMVLRGYPNNATGSITVGDVTSLVQHSGDFRFYRTNGSINELYFQVNSTAAYHRGNQIWDTSDFSSTNVSNWNTAYSWGNHASAGYLTSSSLSGYATETHVSSNYLSKFHDITLTLTGDVSGSGTFNNMGNLSFDVQVADDSHNHDGRYYTETEVNNLLAGKLSTSGKAADSNLLDGLDSTAFQRQVDEYIVNIANPDAVSGTWTNTDGDDWGTPRLGSNLARYNDGNGYVQYNIPSGMETAYISQLTWDSGGYADIQGVQADGGLVFLRRINTKQNIENSNEGSGGGNPNQHDGSTITLIGTGLSAFSAIRIQNRSGRIHLTGMSFTSAKYHGAEGTGMVHPAQISDGLNATTLDSLGSSSFLRSDTSDIMSFNTSTGEVLRFQNSTSGGKIQVGFQQNDTDGLHHRAYLKAYKSSAGNVAGKFDIVIRSSGGGTTSDVFELEAGAKAKWQGNNLATESYVTTSISNLVDSAPGTLDTLNELAAALGDDPNFATTVTNSIAAKLPLAGGTMTGTLRLPWKWNSTDITANSFYVQRSATEDGFAFGIGTGVSTWFSWDGAVGTKRAIDVWNDGSKILLGAGGHDTEISNNLYVPNHVFHTDDTDTYMQFHAADQWRVVTGGAERLEVNNTQISVSNNLVVAGTVSGSNLNVSNWNTAYGWGNHASAGYLTSFDITSQTDPKYLRSDANDTKTGDTTFTGQVTLQTNLVITEDAPTISFLDTSSSDDFYIHVNSNNFYVLRNTNNSENIVDGGWDSPHPLQLEGDTNVGYLFSNRIFADNYHPNADKWTTARTLSLTGDVTGSVSWDGSGNASITTTVADDSHNHVISNIDGLQTALDGKQAAGLLNRNGLITTNDWNTFYTDDTLRVVSAHNFTAGANNAPDNSYNYGAALTYRRINNEAFQLYFPENNGNSTNGNRRVAFRTGWNGGWSSWRRFVDMIDNVGYVTGGNDTGFEVHSDVGYNQDPGTYFLLRGQADNNQPYALKILLTGNASGNDIEWRRLKMNGSDDRMYYAPEGQNQITFEYTVVTPSDARLKDNVKNISSPIEKLSKLNGCEFDWNSGVHEGKHDVGVIAQEVEAVIPEAVGEGSDGIKSVAYDKLVPLLIESVKEQQAMIEELKQEIQNLKNK